MPPKRKAQPKKNSRKEQEEDALLHQLSIDTAGLMRDMSRGRGAGARGASRGGGGGGQGGFEALAALFGGLGMGGFGGGGGGGGMPRTRTDFGAGAGPSYFDATRTGEVKMEAAVTHSPKSFCGCSTSSQFGSCPLHEIPFADCHAFPRFKELPNFHQPFGRYLSETRGTLMPKRPWFFMGELLDSAVPFLRSRCPLTTRHGDRHVSVFFYPEDAADSAYLNTQQPKMKKGATLVLSSPMWKVFMDGQQGIREEGKNYYVLAAPLKVITCYGRLLLHNADAAHSSVNKPEEAMCVFCARTASQAAKGGESTDAKPLVCCTKCNTALYCSPECQRKDWAKGHKDLCADSQRILKLASAHRAKSSPNALYTCDNYEPPATVEKRFNLLRYPSAALSALDAIDDDGSAGPAANPKSLTREDILGGKLEALAYGKSPFEGMGAGSDDDDDDDYGYF